MAFRPAFPYCDLILAAAFCALTSCGASTPDKALASASKKDSFQIRETIVDSTKAGMISFSGFKRKDEYLNLCQHWELNSAPNASASRLLFDEETEERLYRDLVLFQDSSVVYNHRLDLRIGKWTLQQRGGGGVLLLDFGSSGKQELSISELSSRSMRVIWDEGGESYDVLMQADGKVHQSVYSDPLHPSNLQWMIAPTSAESEEQLRNRVRQCVKFYALYYRDAIKREDRVIEFAGLPRIFIWYNSGIGLERRDELHESWVRCFYNKEQALQGYDMLSELIVKYEFDWPTGTPTWLHKTHSVLEQMYHKL